jgi:predicted ATPase/DNA-binding CsgD family transcriptional regulator
MRATLDWSYGLLSPAEQHLLCHVAAFADTCSLEALESVSGDGHPGHPVLETLDRLVDKSMVLAEEREGLVRYRMLEPVRQYASEQLQASGTDRDARQRHLEFFVAYGEEREQASNIGGERRLAATGDIAREYPNIRLALNWAIEVGEAQLGLRLVRSVQYFWQVRGYWGEGVAWCERLLALPGAGEATPAYTSALLTAGRLAAMQGRLDLAGTFYERGLPLARLSQDAWVRWVGPENAGLLAYTRGEPARAGELFREARAVAQTIGDRACEATSLHMMAFAAWCESRFEVARGYAEEALRAHRQIAHEWGECLSLVFLGFALFSLDEPSAARRHFEGGLTLARRQDSPVWVGFALDGLGWVASRQGRLKESQSHLIASLDLRREVGAHANIAESLDSVAGLAARCGHPLRACRLAGAAETQRQRIGQTLVPARRQMRDSWMTAVLHDLGEQAAEALSAGTQLSLEEAIALAHEGDGPVAATIEPRLMPAPHLDFALTPRERQVVLLLARGLSNPQIADELVISPRTAQRHVENILGKLGFGSRAQVAAWAVSSGLVPSASNSAPPDVASVHPD